MPGFQTPHEPDHYGCIQVMPRAHYCSHLVSSGGEEQGINCIGQYRDTLSRRSSSNGIVAHRRRDGQDGVRPGEDLTLDGSCCVGQDKAPVALSLFNEWCVQLYDVRQVAGAGYPCSRIAQQCVALIESIRLQRMAQAHHSLAQRSIMQETLEFRPRLFPEARPSKSQIAKLPQSARLCIRSYLHKLRR